MAVQFELYKTPMPKEKKNKTRYHARPVSFETVNTEKLAYRIHDRSTLRVSDIISTLEELKNPQDLTRSRIYDRVLERCVPLRINNQNIRQRNAAESMKEARKILESGTGT